MLRVTGESVRGHRRKCEGAQENFRIAAPESIR